MKLHTQIQRLKQAPLVTCKISPPSPPSSRGIQLIFSHNPPEEPGVYLVYQLQTQKPFYVGEASNLNTRLKFLFRCYRNNNPHPCHINHRIVYEEWPEADTFCGSYGVRWITTTELIGRIEIEDELKRVLGTNCKAFYHGYDPEFVSSEGEFGSGEKASPNCLERKEAREDNMGDSCSDPCILAKACNGCPIWLELSTNPKYQNTKGIAIPTMGGRADNLLFCFDPQNHKVRVWRETGKPDFKFGVDICKMLCRRYQQGLREGFLPQPPELGGAGYFTISEWPTLPLGMINTPFAAAVIRHVWP